MRQYLGSAVLREQVARFWATGKPVGAICHGVLVLARTRDSDGRSILAGRRTTCLPRYMERTAYLATAWRLGRYYRTYPAYVEDEVKTALDNPASQFQRGPVTLTRPRHRYRRHGGFRRARPQLPLRPLARRRLPVRPPLPRPPPTSGPPRC
jgi:putative intracellular protease/amidase